MPLIYAPLFAVNCVKLRLTKTEILLITICTVKIQYESYVSMETVRFYIAKKVFFLGKNLCSYLVSPSKQFI